MSSTEYNTIERRAGTIDCTDYGVFLKSLAKKREVTERLLENIYNPYQKDGIFMDVCNEFRTRETDLRNCIKQLTMDIEKIKKSQATDTDGSEQFRLKAIELSNKELFKNLVETELEKEGQFKTKAMKRLMEFVNRGVPNPNEDEC